MAKNQSTSDLRSISADEDSSYVRDIEAERARVLAEKPNKQAQYLKHANFLSNEDARTAWKNETISTYVNQYFDILRQNGPVEDKPTTTDNDSVWKGDVDAQRLQYIKDQAGMTDAEAQRVYKEMTQWFSGSGSFANTTVLDDYVRRAPAYSGTIYRGMYMQSDRDMADFMKNIHPGGVIGNRNGENSSWAHSEEMSRHYANSVPGRSVMLVDVSPKRTATPVAAISHQGEEEVLAASDTQWTVLRSEQKGDRLYVYVIERGKRR